ncbi:MAG: metallophosphoesterase [Clostridia bacterium]|nr:metallophosphoesterase [Clostridia bacterium]
MKTVKVSLGNFPSVEIHTFSDWHIGDRACDEDTIMKEVQCVRDTDNAFVICNGDLMNNATKASVSDCYSEEIPPMEQLQRLCDLLEPIKDKILLLTQGNHEARTFRADGIDLTALLAKQLGIYDRYVREGGVLFLRFGDSPNHHRPVHYSFYCTHGSGGGRKEGAKAIRLADMASIVDCDIYLHSHTHLPMVMKQNFYRTNISQSTVSEVEKLFVNSAAKLGYGGYGQTYEFKPSNTTSPVIYLDGRKKQFSARL